MQWSRIARTFAELLTTAQAMTSAGFQACPGSGRGALAWDVCVRTLPLACHQDWVAFSLSWPGRAARGQRWSDARRTACQRLPPILLLPSRLVRSSNQLSMHSFLTPMENDIQGLAWLLNLSLILKMKIKSRIYFQNHINQLATPQSQIYRPMQLVFLVLRPIGRENQTTGNFLTIRSMCNVLYFFVSLLVVFFSKLWLCNQ